MVFYIFSHHRQWADKSEEGAVRENAAFFVCSKGKKKKSIFFKKLRYRYIFEIF